MGRYLPCCRLAPNEMEFTRRQLAAAGATAVGGALVGSALWDAHLLCPDPATPAWDLDDAEALQSMHFGYWGPPVLAGDAAYVTQGHGIVAGGSGVLARVDRESGSVRWTVDREPAGFGTPNAVDDVVYAPTGQNELLALDAADGAVRWRVDAGVSETDTGESFALDQPVATDVGVVVQTFQGPTANAFDGEHAVAGVETATGEVAWTRSLPARARAVGAGGGDVLVAAEDGSVQRLDAATGDVRWRETVAGTPRPIRSRDASATLALVVDDDTVIGVDATEGSVAWRASVPPADQGLGETPTPVPNAVVGGGLVLAGRGDGSVVAHALQSGERRFRYDAGAPTFAVDVNPDEGVAVAMDARGFAHVLDVTDGSRTGRVATAPRDSGETCGYRVREAYRRMRYVTVDADGAFVAAHGVARFGLPG